MNKGLNTGLRLALVAVITAMAVGTAGAAGAQDVTDPYVGPSPTVENEVVSQEPAAVPSSEAQSSEAQSAPSAEVQGTNLALTGGDGVALAAIGLAALVAGSLVLASRRRNVAAD